MRITQNAMFHQVTADINKAADRLFERRRQVASSKRLATASDDPIGAGLAVSLRASIARLLQTQRNGDQAEARLQASQGELTDVLAIIDEAKDLAFRGTDGVMSPAERQDLAIHVNERLERLLADANARSIDGYLFGGTQIAVAPFSAARDVNGDITGITPDPGISGQVKADLPGGQQVVTNVPGSTVFTVTLPQMGDDIFSLLIEVRDRLRADNVAGVEAILADFETAADQVRTVVADVGSRIARIRDVRERSHSDLLSLKARLSKIEDVDIAEAAIELQQAQDVYQAALAAASKIVQNNLVNYLG